MDANNTKMINALTATVLANVTDYDITCEVSRRGLNLDITTLKDDDLVNELCRRGLKLTVNLEDVLGYVAEGRAKWVNNGCPIDVMSTELMRIASALPDVMLWEAIADKDGIGSKWASENPSEALAHIDECDLEDHCREWVSDNMSEVMEWIDLDLVVDELTREQKSQLLVALANEARF